MNTPIGGRAPVSVSKGLAIHPPAGGGHNPATGVPSAGLGQGACGLISGTGTAAGAAMAEPDGARCEAGTAVAAEPTRSLMAGPERDGSEAECTALPSPIPGAIVGLAPGEAGQLLRLSTSDRAGVAVVSVHGELDLLATSALQACLSDLRARGPARSVADLTGLAFLDCACLGVLVRHCKEIRGQGGSFALAAPQPAVYKILAVTGLLDWFEVHDTVGEAVASVSA